MHSSTAVSFKPTMLTKTSTGWEVLGEDGRIVILTSLKHFDGYKFGGAVISEKDKIKLEKMVTSC